MSEQHDPLRLIVSISAMVVLLAIVILDIRSLGDRSLLNQTSLATAHPANASGRELERCRTITPEQLASDDVCQRAWAETRRHFFALDHNLPKPTAISTPTLPSQPSVTSPVTNNQVDSGRPTTPKPRSE